MRRRSFLTLLGGAATAWPVVARAQRNEVPVVAYLMSRSESDAAYLAAGFREGLRTGGGFIEGHNIKIEYRWANGQMSRLPVMAQELVHIPVSVIAAVGGEPAVMAAKSATSTIPIVFAMSGDPVKLRVAESFNRPGLNATGIYVFTTTMEPKRLGLLHEVAPHVKSIAAFINEGFPSAEAQLSDMQEAAKQIDVRLRVFRVDKDREIDAAFVAIATEQIGALAVAASPYFDTRREKIVTLAEHQRVASIYHFREYAAAGGLMSYGVDIRDAHRQVGIYTAQILRGAKVADLPIVQPTKFEFVINLRTARALGLTVPATLLARADEVIE
jgi:putative ABC transport system substrate-binding protein